MSKDFRGAKRLYKNPWLFAVGVCGSQLECVAMHFPILTEPIELEWSRSLLRLLMTVWKQWTNNLRRYLRQDVKSNHNWKLVCALTDHRLVTATACMHRRNSLTYLFTYLINGTLLICCGNIVHLSHTIGDRSFPISYAYARKAIIGLLSFQTLLLAGGHRKEFNHTLPHI